MRGVDGKWTGVDGVVRKRWATRGRRAWSGWRLDDEGYDEAGRRRRKGKSGVVWQ